MSRSIHPASLRPLLAGPPCAGPCTRLLAGSLLGVLVLAASGCAEPEEEPTLDRAESVFGTIADLAPVLGQVRALLPMATNVVGFFVNEKDMKEIRDGSGTFNQALEVLGFVMSLLGGDDMSQLGVGLLDLQQQLSGLSWQVSQQFLAQDIALATSALEQAQLAFKTGMTITADGAPMNNSATALAHAEQDIAFQRTYVRPDAGILAAVGEPDHPNDLVYDWKLGIPLLMRMISMRLAVLSVFDPNWMQDGLFYEEIKQHREVLMSHLRRMKEGIRCGVIPAEACSGFGTGCIDTYACVDVHSGIVNTNWDEYINEMPYEESMDLARREIMQQMPIYEVQQMIDMLYLLMYPGVGDIKDGYIYSYTSPSSGGFFDELLCLDVQGGGTDNGTPVWLYTCSEGNPAQRWSYDRASGALINVGSGKCLDVVNVDPKIKASVQIWDCVGNDAQRWTWDLEHGYKLQNALGTVLDVQWGRGESETPVWTWSFQPPSSYAQTWVPTLTLE